jgi:hypothetical protein
MQVASFLRRIMLLTVAYWPGHILPYHLMNSAIFGKTLLEKKCVF